MATAENNLSGTAVLNKAYLNSGENVER